MIAAFAALAHAGVPLLYDGGDAAAVTAAVAEKTGLPAAQLSPLSLDAVLAGPPVVLGEASLRRCAREPSSLSAMQAEFGRAQAAYASKDDAVAMDHLDLALSLAGCLPAIVEPQALAQVFLLRGAVAISGGDDSAAGGELRSALALVPDATWPPAWGPEGATALATEQANPSRFDLLVIPEPAASGPWIDGRAAGPTVALAPGLHLAQYAGSSGIRSAWLTVGGAARLVLPGAYRRPLLERMTDPAGRAAVSALLEASVPELDAAYVAHAGGIWLVSRDATGLVTEELVAPVPVAPAPAVEAPKKGRRP